MEELTPREKADRAEENKKKNAAPPRRKKKSRFFESYIPRILNQVSENNINTNAKQQLNTILCQICKEFCDKATELTEYAGKKTISNKEIKNSLKLLLDGELLCQAIKEGDDAVGRYNEFNQTKVTLGARLPAHSRTMKAEIIFPPSIMEKFLRRFGHSKSYLTENAPVFLAAVIEYIAVEILNVSSLQAQESSKSRITVRHMELGIRNDPDFSRLFERLNLKFLGSGFTPGIHKELLVKKKIKKKSKEEKDEKTKKAHRYKPGTVALKTIKKYQKTGKLMLARNPFERLVRSIFDEGEIEKKKISKDVFTVLQYHVEQKIIQTLRLANLITIHGKRTKLSDKDILLARFISTNPYNFTIPRYEEFMSNRVMNLTLNASADNREEPRAEEEKEETKAEPKEEFEEVSSEEEEEDEVPTEDSEEELEYIHETDFLETDTEMPWAGPKYFKSRSRLNGTKEGGGIAAAH